MSIFKKILVPDILPNNLRIIRDMRGLALKDVANALKIDRNFLSAVEVNNKNFSGKTTIRALKYYGISFYKMYDVKEKMNLEVTDYFNNIFRVTLAFHPEDLIERDLKLYDEKYKQNIINASLTEDLKQLKENNSIIANIYRVAQKNKVKGEYVDFNLIDSLYKDEKLYLDLEVVFNEKRTEKREFDINFVMNENLQLADKLREMGFREVIRVIERKIDGKSVKIEGNLIKLDQPYKFPKDDYGEKFTKKDTIKLSDRDLKIKYDPYTKEPVSIKFRVLKPEMNNLKTIRSLLKIPIEEMHKSLGLTYNGYINLEVGNQKISTKVMWRLVKKLNLPLELIINIDEYYEKYCVVSNSNDI